MTDLLAQNVAIRIAQLRKHFIFHEGYTQAQDRVGELTEKRAAELQLGGSTEGRGIAVIGESGSGKTTAVGKIIRAQTGLPAQDNQLHWISLRVPTPATQKDLARAMLIALGFPIARDTTASRMWEMVNFHLRLRKTWFIRL